MNKKNFDSAIDWAFRKFNVQFHESSLSLVVPEWQWKLAISSARRVLKRNFKADFKSRSFFYTEITTFYNLIEKDETFSFSFSFEDDKWRKKKQRDATRLVFRVKKKGSKKCLFRVYVSLVVYRFTAYTSESAYTNGDFYFMKDFISFSEMKNFSAEHSVEGKKFHPEYCSTYNQIKKYNHE